MILRILSRQTMTNAQRGLLLLSGLVACGLLVGFGQPAVSPTDEKPATTTREPIPVDAAPPELKRLIADGKVKVVYDSDPEFEKAQQGWATFNLLLEQTFHFKRTKVPKNGQSLVKAVVTKLTPKIELTHLIRLPASFKAPDIWQSTTLRHEFDHVAVSLDPRALMLLRHLLEHLPVVELTLEPDEEPSDERIRQLINEEIKRRHEAVLELMRQNNVLLDKVSRHGTRPVPDRAVFFAKLYTKEHLAEMKFPFVDQVLDLLKSSKYEKVELRFVPRDPTEPSTSP